MTLRPASADRFTVELLGCLTLCAPAGMTEEQRVEWVKVARATIGHLPEDLLKAGCAEARRQADHPSKIVPIIMETVSGSMKIRREHHRGERIPPERRIEEKACDPADAIAILEAHGLPVPDVLRRNAQGIEARRAETEGLGSREPGAEGMRPQTVSTTMKGEGVR